MKAQKNDMTTYDCHPIKAEYDHLRLTADHCRKLTHFVSRKKRGIHEENSCKFGNPNPK